VICLCPLGIHEHFLQIRRDKIEYFVSAGKRAAEVVDRLQWRFGVVWMLYRAFQVEVEPMSWKRLLNFLYLSLVIPRSRCQAHGSRPANEVSSLSLMPSNTAR